MTERPPLSVIACGDLSCSGGPLIWSLSFDSLSKRMVVRPGPRGTSGRQSSTPEVGGRTDVIVHAEDVAWLASASGALDSHSSRGAYTREGRPALSLVELKKTCFELTCRVRVERGVAGEVRMRPAKIYSVSSESGSEERVRPEEGRKRKTATETVTIHFSGSSTEIDMDTVDRVLGTEEHMLRLKLRTLANGLGGDEPGQAAVDLDTLGLGAGEAEVLLRLVRSGRRPEDRHGASMSQVECDMRAHILTTEPSPMESLHLRGGACLSVTYDEELCGGDRVTGKGAARVRSLHVLTTSRGPPAAKSFPPSLPAWSPEDFPLNSPDAVRQALGFFWKALSECVVDAASELGTRLNCLGHCELDLKGLCRPVRATVFVSPAKPRGRVGVAWSVLSAIKGLPINDWPKKGVYVYVAAPREEFSGSPSGGGGPEEDLDGTQWGMSLEGVSESDLTSLAESAVALMCRGESTFGSREERLVPGGFVLRTDDNDLSWLPLKASMYFFKHPSRVPPSLRRRDASGERSRSGRLRSKSPRGKSRHRA